MRPIECDRCGKRSPNKSGTDIAENWLVISVRDKGTRPERTKVYDICNSKECTDKVITTIRGEDLR